MGSGGGGSQTTTVDPVYNAGLLKLSQEQQGWAAEMYNQFKYGVPYDPNERGAMVDGQWKTEAELGAMSKPSPTAKSGLRAVPASKEELMNGGRTKYYNGDQEIPSAEYQRLMNEPQTGGTQQYDITTRGAAEGYNPDETTSEMEYLQNLVNANQDLLGLQTDVSKNELGLTNEQIDAQRELLPLQTGLETEQIGAQRELLPLATGLTKEQIGAQRELLPLQTGVSKQRLGLASTFLEDVNKGIDVNSRMNEAQAGVQHGFKNARRAADINTFSYGLDPSSGRFASSNRDLQLAEAGGIAGARTGAKNQAEQEDFERKKAGLQLTY